MKTCPVCKAVAFDDAEVCYGCLHRFEGPGERRQVDVAPGPPPRGDGAVVASQEGREPSMSRAKPVGKSVSVPVRGADIVVRIEVVESPHVKASLPDEAVCRLLRGAGAGGAACARPAEAQRGALAGQRAQELQNRPRHALGQQVSAAGAQLPGMRAVGA